MPWQTLNHYALTICIVFPYSIRSSHYAQIAVNFEVGLIED